MDINPKQWVITLKYTDADHRDGLALYGVFDDQNSASAAKPEAIDAFKALMQEGGKTGGSITSVSVQPVRPV